MGQILVFFEESISASPADEMGKADSHSSWASRGPVPLHCGIGLKDVVLSEYSVLSD